MVKGIFVGVLLVVSCLLSADLMPMELPLIHRFQKKKNINIPDAMSTAEQMLINASAAGNVRKVLRALRLGAYINAMLLNRATPLHLAVMYNHGAVVRALLAADADLEVVLENGATPLHAAIQNDRIDIMRLLLAASANVNAAQDNGARPLHIAAQYGNIRMLRTLLGMGAHVNVAQENGETPLQLAIHNRHHEAAEILRAAGAIATPIP